MGDVADPHSTGSGTPDPDSGGSDSRQWWRWLLGLGLLTILVVTIGPRQLAATFARIDPRLALAVAALSVVWLASAAFKVWVLLRTMSPIPFKTFLPVYGTSWAASQLLPGQLGDATQVFLLRRHDVPVAQSSAAYVVDKCVSVSWLSMVALYGIGRFAPGWSGPRLALVPLLGGGLVVLSLALLLKVRAKERGPVARGQALLRSTLLELRGMQKYPGALALNFTLTVVKWVIVAFMYVGAFLAFGRPVSIEAAATIPVMSSLVGYLPITAGGAGTIELTGVYLFGRLGIDSATVLAVFLFFRAELLLIALVLTLADGQRKRPE